VAARQWGAITRLQLRGVGFSDDEIEGMVRRGQLIRMHRGVYVLGARSPAPEQRWAAALLAAGKGAVLSHTASAGNFGWIQPREIIGSRHRGRGAATSTSRSTGGAVSR
jgi:hypothetical protein